MRRKVLIFTGLSVGILFSLSGCGKKEEPVAKEIIRPVKTMTVAAGTVCDPVQDTLRRVYLSADRSNTGYWSIVICY